MSNKKESLLDEILEEELADLSVSEDEPMEIPPEAVQTEQEIEQIPGTTKPEQLKTKSANKKILLTLLFITVNVLAILLTAVMEFASEEQPVPLSNVWDIFLSNWGWAVGAIALVVLTIAFNALMRFVFLRTTLKKNLPIVSLNATIMCKYYDNITPLGSGGQPFEIYYLRKKGVPVGIASGVPVVSYSLNRFAYVFVSLLTIFIYGFGPYTTTFINILCIVGLVINALIPIAILIFTIQPRIGAAISRFVAKLAKTLHLTKDEDAFNEKLSGSIREYAECVRYFMHKSKWSIFIGFVCSCAHFVALYSIPYFAIRMSGNHTVSWGEMFALCIICYASVTLLPTPGNSGGAELSFRSIFATFLSGGILFWGITAWRIFSYYAYILLGITLIIAQQIYKHTRRGRAVEQKNAAFEKGAVSSQAAPPDEDELYTPVPTAKHITDADSVHQDSPLQTVIEAQAVIEHDVTPTDPQDITQPDDAEQVMQFATVIESRSTVTISEEFIESDVRISDPKNVISPANHESPNPQNLIRKETQEKHTPLNKEEDENK